MNTEELLDYLKLVRNTAWISYADDRTVQEMKRALRAILVITKFVGNDEPSKELLEKFVDKC